MDYFSTQALPYPEKDWSISMPGRGETQCAVLDEMHIQQDWSYFQHHDHGEFAQRYVRTDWLAFSPERYGQEYRDLRSI